jgi:ectoine hydroxylase-related dioxygenase (phytanoyl-CoA dioxygenase family)
MTVKERAGAPCPQPESIEPLDEETARFLVDRIRMDGYAVLEDAVPLALIERMRDRFDQLLEARIQADGPNRGASRYQMFLPWEEPFTDSLVIENPRAMPLLEQLLGQDLTMTYLASDTPLPGSDYQRVHTDTRLLFPETPLSLPPYCVVANLPLVDVTEENGPLELWPGGTHYMPGRLDLAALAPTMRSVRLTLKAGSILLRDARCWHRGTPNQGTRSRPHVALVYNRGWYRFEQRPIEIPRAAYEALPERTQRLLRVNTLIG